MFFRDSRQKWLLGFIMDKMVTKGRLLIHLHQGSQLSKKRGGGQFYLPWSIHHLASRKAFLYFRM